MKFAGVSERLLISNPARCAERNEGRSKADPFVSTESMELVRAYAKQDMTSNGSTLSLRTLLSGFMAGIALSENKRDCCRKVEIPLKLKARCQRHKSPAPACRGEQGREEKKITREKVLCRKKKSRAAKNRE